MRTYEVTVPVAGFIVREIEAETPQAAISIAVEQGVDIQEVQNLEAYKQFVLDGEDPTPEVHTAEAEDITSEGEEVEEEDPEAQTDSVS